MKEYLGDGVYAEFVCWYIVLTTADGLETTNTIYLEPDVLRALFKFSKQHGMEIKE